MSRVPTHTQWIEDTTADNAAATVTHAAETDRIHFVTSIHASFDTAQTAAKALTLSDTAGTLATWYVYDNLDISFDAPIKIAQGDQAQLSLAASGTGGQNGAVVLMGYTL